MSAEPYHYLHLDVFTDRLFGGNQLAVFTTRGARHAGTGLAAAPLSVRDLPVESRVPTALMQAITREMAYSECTFVFPPDRAGTDVHVRIFTPGAELPMAGHPTIGTAFALAHLGLIPPGQAGVVFSLGVGPTQVSLRWVEGKLAFAEMTQRPPEFGRPVAALDEVAAALGVTAADVRATNLPVQEVSCGIPFLMVPLATRAAVDAASINPAGFQRLCRTLNVAHVEVFFFSTEHGDDDATAYSRMFAPGLGVSEDPATGSASGPLGCYLVRHGVVAPADAGRILSLQGVRMGRPSRVHIAIEGTPADITCVGVGGTAVLVGEGTIDC